MPPNGTARRVCLVTTSPLIVNFFLVPLLRALATRYEVALAVNDQEGVALPADLPGHVHAVRIVRQISPLADLAALWTLYRLFRAERFDAVHSISPKGGLLAMTAARLAGVPVRVHTFTGQVWVTRKGPMRWLLKRLDRWIASSATHVLADSASQRRFLVEQGVVAAERCQVLASGSISGVDSTRFRPDPVARAAVRSELGVDESTVLLAFIGRIGRDKGVLDLASAFDALHGKGHPVALVFVGPDEESLHSELEARAGNAASAMRFVPYTRAPERYLAAADALCLPSYREGFGSVIIEAAATGIPGVGSRIYGLTDAIVDGETGFLHEPRDVADIVAKLTPLVADGALRRRLGAKAQERARREFSQEAVTDALLGFYRRVLGA
jgi:glycosyltransferase involved in cell wall biosynthesis